MSKTHKKVLAKNSRPKRTTFKKHSKHYMKVYAPYLPAILIFGMAISIWLGIFQAGKSGVLSTESTQTPQSLLLETNKQRYEAGQPKLQLNSKLNLAAETKANDMVQRNYWSHIAPDGKEPWAFVQESGYNYSKAAENLAYGFSSSASTIKGWMNSESHRQTMLDSGLTDVGFGVAKAQNFQSHGEETIVVALYAKPSNNSSNAVLNLTNNSSSSKPISFAQTLTDGKIPIINFFVGLILGLSVMYLTLKHSLKLRRKLKHGEDFIIHHPVLDLTLISIISLCFVVIKTVGYIN